MFGKLSSQDSSPDKIFLDSIKVLNPELQSAHEVGGLLLAMAIHQESLESLQYLISKGVDVNKSYKGLTPLMHAIKFRKPECVRILLDEGADIDWKGSFGESALFGAAAMKNLEMVKFLLNRGADINIKRLDGRTPLMHAVLNGSQDTCIVQHLLDAGADVQLQDEKELSALHFAQTEELIDTLVEKGADVKAVDINGYTALHRRVWERNPDLPAIKRLVYFGAEVNAKDNEGYTPLLVCVRRHHQPMVKYLLSEDADPNATSKSSDSALFIACITGNKKIAELLLAAGAQAGPAFDNSDLSLLHVACRSGAAEEDIFEVIRYLIKQVKIDVNQISYTYGTAVHLACLRDSPSILELLTNKDICDADLAATDGIGRQPIHMATALPSGCFEHLLSLGCDIRATDKTGRNALHWAAQGGNVDIVSRILDQPDVAINERDLGGWTALCWATRGKYRGDILQANLIDLLLKKGADKSVRVKGDGDEIDWTPLEIAIYHQAGDEVIRLLRQQPTDEQSIDEFGSDSFQEIGLPHYDKEADNRTLCDACLADIHGKKYFCIECEKFELCFKCFAHRKAIHTTDHEFDFAMPPPDDGSENDSSRVFLFLQ